MAKRDKERKSRPSAPKEAPISLATHAYESWLAMYTPLIAKDLQYKHQQMSLGVFPFLRATFYRWVQVWPEVCAHLTSGPTVLAVGDLHIENFGTWRDREGRLVWGVNDFDEACYLPYTNDLVRLATSVHLAVEANKLRFDGERACAAILRGYTEGMKAGGRPFVLEEAQPWLRDIALANLRDPVRFWQKMDGLPDVERQDVPESAIVAIEHMLPQGAPEFRIKHRVAGLGSLGHPRYMALMDWSGGKLAREAKALVPSARVWASGATPRQSADPDVPHSSLPVEIYYQAIVDRAIRCADPTIALQGHWIVRRLAPFSARIELTALASEEDEERLLHATGWETANIHLGSGKTTIAAPILKDIERLQKRDRAWLSNASHQMADAMRADWPAWRTDAEK